MLPWRVFPINCLHSIDLIWFFGHQFVRYVEHLFHWEIFWILDGMQIVWVILPREYVSPFYRTSQLANSEDFDFRVWFSPGFLMQWKQPRQESLRFIARPNSSSASMLLWLFLHLNFCVLFDITTEHSAELKWLMLNNHKRWFHSSRVKFPLVNMSANWVFGVNIFDLAYGVQINSIEKPIKSNSVGSGNMSHCRASSLHDHLDHFLVVFKHIQQSFLTRRMDVWGNKMNIVQIIDHCMRLLSFLICVRCWTQVSPCFMTLNCVSKDWGSCSADIHLEQEKGEVKDREFNCCQCTKFTHFLTCTRIPCRNSHCKNGLVKCCLYTPCRLQQTAVSCKRSNCNKIREKNLESRTSEVLSKDGKQRVLPVLSRRFARKAHLWTFFELFWAPLHCHQLEAELYDRCHFWFSRMALAWVVSRFLV